MVPPGSRRGLKIVTSRPTARSSASAVRSTCSSSCHDSPPGMRWSTAGMRASSRTSTSRWTQKPALPPAARRSTAWCAAAAAPAARTPSRPTACSGLGRVAEAEGDDVLVPEQGAAAFEVGEQPRATAGGQGELHRGRLPGRLRRRLVEVGVAVEEQQAVASAAFQGEEVAEQDRAVTAEDHGKAAPVENTADRVGQAGGVLRDTGRVEDPGGRVPLGIVSRRLDPAGPRRPQAVLQPRVEQSRRQVLDTGWAQPQYGRCLDDRQLLHAGTLSSAVGHLTDQLSGTPTSVHGPPERTVRRADSAVVRRAARAGAATRTRLRR